MGSLRIISSKLPNGNLKSRTYVCTYVHQVLDRPVLTENYVGKVTNLVKLRTNLKGNFNSDRVTKEV